MSLNRLVPVLLIAVAVGCSSIKKPPTIKEAAKKQWNSARANVLYNLAKSQFESGTFDKCRKTLQDALAMEPENPALHILLARLNIEEGNLEAAERSLKGVRQLQPNNGEVDYLTGIIYQRWQRTEAALEAYTQAVQKQPTELSYLLAKAEMMVALNRGPQALAMLREKVTFFENSSAIRDAVGQLLVTQGRLSEGTEMLRTASVLAPDDLSIREHLSLALYYNKQYREASIGFHRLLQDERYQKRADLFLAHGECLLQLDRVRDAREAFETSAQLDPTPGAVWIGLAKAAIVLKDERRVEMSLRKAQALEPNNPEPYLMTGYLRLQQKRLPEAVSAFHKASALDATDTVSLCMIGYALEKMGQNSLAGSYYARALRLKPNDELAARLMAQLQVHE